MKIVLLKTVNQLGRVGEQKEVNEGYARNFLFPRGLATVATAAIVEGFKARAAAAERAKERELGRAKKIAKALNGVKVTVSAKASESGTLFGAVALDQIVAALRQKGVELDGKYLVYSEPIKKLGEHKIAYKLADGSSGQFKLIVNKE
ncbi:MAG: 50S ribosomal protein L9 [Patescibacteria group bacterium]|jgi:large subunit ribosomal protein L9